MPRGFSGAVVWAGRLGACALAEGPGRTGKEPKGKRRAIRVGRWAGVLGAGAVKAPNVLFAKGRLWNYPRLKSFYLFNALMRLAHCRAIVLGGLLLLPLRKGGGVVLARLFRR